MCGMIAANVKAVTLWSAEAITVPHRMIWSWYTGRWWVGCYIWQREDRTARGRSPPGPLLAVPNVTAHPSTASVPITVALRFKCTHKGSKELVEVGCSSFATCVMSILTAMLIPPCNTLQCIAALLLMSEYFTAFTVIIRVLSELLSAGTHYFTKQECALWREWVHQRAQQVK